LFQRTKTDANLRLSPSLYWLIAFLYLLLTLLIYLKVQPAPFYQIAWESSHFLWRLKLMEIYGLRPYEDFQVSWGPALVYAPAFLHRLLRPWGVSYEGSYYACHYLMNLASLYCLFYLVNRSTMPLNRKKLTFVILGCASFAPYMALNGVTGRYLMPYLTLIVLHTLLPSADRHASQVAQIRLLAVAVLATLLNASISPEIGLTFVLALAAYSLLLGRTRPAACLSLILALVLGLVLCYVLLPPAYYVPLLRVSSGANNLPLLPAVHILFYLVTLFLVIPPVLTVAIQRHGTDTPLLAGLAILSLLSIRGALGRCDPPHVFFYGLGTFLLAFILLSRTSRRRFVAYAVAFACVFIIGWQWSNMRVFYGVGSSTDLARLAQTVVSRRSSPSADGKKAKDSHSQPYRGYLADPRRLDKYPSLGLPFGNSGTDKMTEDYLWKARKIAPEYYVGGLTIYTEAELKRKIRDVSSNEYLLLMKGWNMFGDRDTCIGERKYLRLAFIYPVRLPCRRKGFDPDARVSKYIANNYDIVEENGIYIVLRRSPQL
jgi:hypothetical protein